MRGFPWASLAGSAVVFVSFLYFMRSDTLLQLQGFMGNSAGGAAAYVFILVIGVVIAPITVLPVIPVAAATFGPFATSLLTVVGWTIGASIAFLIARLFGRPIVTFFIPLAHVAALEKKMSRADEFVGLVLLRMVVPVELLSYAVGLFTKIPMPFYILATILGVAPFSFLFSYGGAALASRSYGLLALLAVLGGLLFMLAARHYREIWRS